MQIVRREAFDAAACLRGIERLVEVDHQRDVGTDDAAHRLHHALVVGGIAVAALDLDAAKALIQRALQVLLIGLGIDYAVAVIGLDRPRRSAEQFGQWPTRRLSERIPKRHVEARHRHADETLPTEQPEFRVHLRHQIERRDGLADQIAADLFDQMHQRLQRQRGISENVGASGNALIGRDIDQHQRRGLDDAKSVLDRPRDRRDDGAGLDAANGGGGCAHGGSLFDTVPSHETGRGPIGRHGLDQPMADVLGCKGDALGLSGIDASVSSQNGFQPSSRRSSRRK